ncbi:glycine rich nucleic binding domain [Teratosphaeria destructans]|uniref:Glycine rich nucleic binding domain n=1 Tax=Teratosphaeria destructans TaxID=418781 RepID=A0A9W7SKX5_9PEZI|nr:glycine rich nucleic binding domain [Teratosphaeria destructans]
MAGYRDEEYEVPLRDQRYFGAGIKRKRVQFVPSTEDTPSVRSLPVTPPALSAADRYLSIVRKGRRDERATSAAPRNAAGLYAQPDSETELPAQAADVDDEDGSATPGDAARAICGICNRPVEPSAASAHESTLTHQIALQHSHPPSNVDRKRKGFAVLESQGWDPDSRLGLGAKGSEGRLQPVRATEKVDRAGVGAKLDGSVKVQERVAGLDAGKVQVLEGEKKRKAETLRNAFYRSEEVERYLGQDQVNPGLDMAAFKRAKRWR